jgi:hypothetical protein
MRDSASLLRITSGVATTEELSPATGIGKETKHKISRVARPRITVAGYALIVWSEIRVSPEADGKITLGRKRDTDTESNVGNSSQNWGVESVSRR